MSLACRLRFHGARLKYLDVNSVFSDVRLQHLSKQDRKEWYASLTFMHSDRELTRTPALSWFSAIQTLAVSLPVALFSLQPLVANVRLPQNLSSIPVSSLAALPASFAPSKVPYFTRQVKSLLKISGIQAAVPKVGNIIPQDAQQAEAVAFFREGAEKADNWGGGMRGIVHGDYKVGMSSQSGGATC